MGKLVRVADEVMELLAARGVQVIFTVSGGGSIFLGDALAQSRRISYICCHHEQAVAIAAEAYARAKESLGVSLVTSGPGGTNAISGVAGSWIDSVPHLTISGQVFLKQTIGRTGLRQLGVQEINIIDLVTPITKYAVMVEKAECTLYHLEKAIYLATTGRPGPVWIDIPGDIQNARVDADQFEHFNPDELPAAEFDSDFAKKVQEAAQRLKQSRRPLFHIGQGVRMAGALDDFFRIVEKYRIPFVTARNANQDAPSDHELNAGRPGTFAQRGANFAVQNADVYIALGTRLSLSQTGYNSKDFARHAVKIMVDIDRSELQKPTLAMDLKIHGDAKAFLQALENELKGEQLDSADWVCQCRMWKAKYPVVLPEYRKQKQFVNSYYFIEVLSDILTAEDVVVTDMGLAFQATHQAFKVKKGQKLFTNSGYASMGWGLPAAVGACFAHNQRRVICIAGEGGLQMTIQELATVMHHKLPIKLFIYNNGGYLTIKQSQEIGFDGRLMGCSQESGISFPDMLKIAEAHEIPAVRIDHQLKLKEQIREIVDSEGPRICELMLDPDQPQIPKAIPMKQPDGSVKRTDFEDLYPFLDREELRANMIAENRKEN